MKFSILRASLCLLVVVVVAGCESADVRPSRLAPSRTASVLACMLASQMPTGTTSAMLESCAREVPKIVVTGLDQVHIDGVLAGTAGPADPGIRAACVDGAGKRAMAAVETMGYGVLIDGDSQRVVVLQQDSATTYHRDGRIESARLLAPSVGTTDSAASAPSACTMAILQAVMVYSICADQQWNGAGCAALRAQMQYCGDPTRLMVDPSLGFVCQPAVNAGAVTSAASTACAGRGGGDGACAPEANLTGWLRDPGGICASPGASVSADRETCVVPVSVKGPKGDHDITAVILWGRTTAGGPIFTAEAARPRRLERR